MEYGGVVYRSKHLGKPGELQEVFALTSHEDNNFYKKEYFLCKYPKSVFK